MSLRHFGIFLAYGPTVDLKKEGLGRLLGAFLKGAADREDVRFVIACPGWSRRGLLEFCESEGIRCDAFDVVSTRGIPLFLRAYLARRRPKRPKKKSRVREFLKKLGGEVAGLSSKPNPDCCLRSYSDSLASLGPDFGGLRWNSGAGFVRPRVASDKLVSAEARCKVFAQIIARAGGRSVLARLSGVIDGGDSLAVALYRLMEEAEIERMLRAINNLPHVKAWYSPTAFWPGFNRISAPRLLCIPDVVTGEFPIGFAEHDPRFLKTVELLEDTIREASHFVTYSERTKWNTLVDRYSVNPEDVSVIPHASWDLSPWIAVRGFPDGVQATRNYCQLAPAASACGVQ